MPPHRHGRVRAVVQRVRRACVTVGGEAVGRINAGLLLLLGVRTGDTEQDAAQLAAKAGGLRVFEGEGGKMRLSPAEAGASLLVVPNFTLYGDCAHGRRPDFTQAAPFEEARTLYLAFVHTLCDAGVPVETGCFGADMQIELTADGPVTLVIETEKLGN